jgi:hypothetical protein
MESLCFLLKRSAQPAAHQPAIVIQVEALPIYLLNRRLGGRFIELCGCPNDCCWPVAFIVVAGPDVRYGEVKLPLMLRCNSRLARPTTG